MASSKNAKIQIETGRTLVPYAAMTDSGDHEVYTVGTIWSGMSDDTGDYSPSIRPNGIVSGVNLGSVNSTNDTVNILGFTCYAKGILTTVTATTATIARATGSFAQIHSITMSSDGAIATVSGTKGAGQTYSETRAAAGGPPYIPIESIELFQIRVNSSTAAAIAASEIYQTVGTHTERYDFPSWRVNNIGDGAYASENAKKNSFVEFANDLPLSHTAGVPKVVYNQYYVPTLEDVDKAMDMVPAEVSHGTTSEEYYNGVIADSSRSLGQGSFTVLAGNAITDPIVQQADKNITVKFFPDRNKVPYILSQGIIGINRSFPVSGQNKISVTVTAVNPSAEFTA